MSNDTPLPPLAIPPGYKQTEVGVIPQEWEVKRLGEVLVFLSTANNPRSDLSETGDVEYIHYGDIHAHPTSILDCTIHSLPYISKTLAKHATYLEDGDLILVDASEDTAGIGKSIELLGATGRNIVAGLHTIACRGKAQDWALGFKSLLQYHPLFRDALVRTATGISVYATSKKNIADVEIPLPPLPEQRAIAGVLADVDGLLAALDRLIAKQRDVKQAAMQQLLTGRTRLPGFGGAWEVKRLEALESRGDIQLLRGSIISQKDISNNPGEYPIYSSSIQSNGLFGKYGRYMLDEELITWSIDGGGHFFYRPKHRFSVTNVCGYIRVLSNMISCKYLAYQLQLLHSRKFFDYTMKAHPSVIRKEYIVSLPNVAEQEAIAAVLRDMDAQIAALEAQRTKTHALKQGMMQQLLTGRTRLVH